jgi:hypothetical protein
LLCPDVLGNGYTTLFFKGTHAMADLDRALQAYQQAVRPSHESFSLLYNLYHPFHQTTSAPRDSQACAPAAANGGCIPSTHGS